MREADRSKETSSTSSSNNSCFCARIRSMRSSIVLMHEYLKTWDRDGLVVTVAAVFSLPLHCRVPPTVQVKDVGGFLEVQTHAAGPQGKQSGPYACRQS